MNGISAPEITSRLPHNADTERAILGAILVDPPALVTVSEILDAGDFFVAAHRRIFAAMQNLAARGQPVERVTLCDRLQDNPEIDALGGAAYIVALSDGVHQKAPVAHWANMVKNASYLRSVAYAGDSLSRAALEPRAEAGDVVDRVQALLRTLSAPIISGNTPLVALSIEELLVREFKPREMLLDPILPEQGLAMLYSYRGIGETFLALGIASAVASGGRFLRWAAPRPRRVLYVDGELPGSTLRERAAMILAGIEDAEPEPDMLRVITPDLQKRPMPDLATPQGQRLLEPRLAGIDLLVLDNLSALCRDGNENEGEGWLPVQEWALGLRKRGIAVLFVHHAGKNKTQRGTSRREDLLDTVLTLKHPADYNPSEGLRCEVYFEKTRSMIGEAAKPFEVRMESGEDDRAIWTWRELEDAKLEQAAALYSTGMSVRDVAEELGVTKSTAGRLRQKWTAGQSLEVSQRPTA
jgi:DnaB-like helicase N terminal domain/AAA domain/Homeodomain-like domain